jgi:hypothetical protein
VSSRSAKRLAAPTSGPVQKGGRGTDPGADLERRVGRTEFNDGALVRLRVPIRVDADSGRDVLTDIDVLAVDVDGRLRISRSILECKSGKGQSGEPDRLLWLAGLQQFLGFERAVLVRQTASRRGRGLARPLGLRTLDVATLAGREAAHAWLPARFGHLDGRKLCPIDDADGRSRVPVAVKVRVRLVPTVPVSATGAVSVNTGALRARATTILRSSSVTV